MTELFDVLKKLKVINKLVFVCLSLSILSCTSISRSSTEKYNNFNYTPGYPETRYAINNSIIDDQTFINLNLDIVKGSLFSKKEENLFVSQVNIEVNIYELESNQVVHSSSVNKTIQTEEYRPFYTDELLKFNKEYPVEPGDYKVEINVLDLKSDKTTNLFETINVPNTQESKVGVTDFKVLSLNEETSEFYPVTTYDIKQSDSIRVSFQIYNLPSKQIVINTDLYKFESDTSYPRPLSSVGFSSSDIEYKGIDYRKFETVFSNRRVLNTVDNVKIENNFEDLTEGNYRFTVNITDGEDLSITKALDFGVKHENYPSIVSPKNLFEPLSLLMDDKEYEKLLSIKTPEGRKREIDRFWLSNIQNKAKAAQVIELFYNRVEQANKLYSTFKEGWKTDRGMMHILFGPPFITQKTAVSLFWSYSTDRYDPRTNFRFREPQTEILYYGFEHYIVFRSRTIIKYIIIKYSAGKVG